jgi:membrane protein DedA with SNARE-associated domain
MENFIAFIYHLIRSHILEATFSLDNPSGLLILFFLAAITDIGVPIPFVLDSILILTAYRMWAMHNSHFAPVILIVLMLFFGRQFGSGILYMISRRLGGAFINWLKCHVPSIGSSLDSFGVKLRSWAPLVVTTGRLTPGLLQVTSVAAGAIRLRYYQFALGIALASIVYDGILVLLAFIAARTPRAHDPNFTIWLLVALIVVVSILWPFIFIMVQRSNKKRMASLKSC